MSEQKPTPPQWGPIADPAPGPWPPWPPWPDPIPWFWKRIPRPFPDGDPIPFPSRVLEQLTIEDFFAVRLATLEIMNEVLQVEIKAQMDLLAKQREILAKYK